MTGNHGQRDTSYEDYDNDANYDPTLNSQSAEYFRNIDTDDFAEMTVDRWKMGGGIQVGDNDKPGGLGIFASGKTRDDDGTIDRVRDPPKELLPLLYKLRCQANSYNIALEEAFVAAGGTHYGTIPTTKFGSCLVVTFHRAGLTEEDISALVNAYGIGNREPERHAKSRCARARATGFCVFFFSPPHTFGWPPHRQRYATLRASCSRVAISFPNTHDAHALCVVVRGSLSAAG